MKRLRAVLDTNTVIAFRRSPHATSPVREVFLRWRAGEFTLCFSDDMLLEYLEKLLALGLTEPEVETFAREIRSLGERIPVVHFHFRHYPMDADDTAFLLCALNGTASHLVTYDDHLLTLRPHYCGQFSICEPVEFLRELRASAAGDGGA